MEISILREVVIMLGFSVLIIFLFQKIKAPTILGFLMAGILIGPSVLGLVKASHEVEIMAEIGIILLLFIIGIEFSLSMLSRIIKTVLIGGGLQVILTILATFGLAKLLGLPNNEALFFGFMISLSSTAIVLKQLQENNKLSTPHGKISLAILIFQDVVVVFFILLTPMLAGKSENIGMDIFWMLLKAAILVVLVLGGARYLVPKILYQVAKTKNRELFLITIVAICFSVASLTNAFDLSLALGAFMAGLIISDSEYSHQATGSIVPFREIFSSIFFVSVGMLLDVNYVINNILLVISITLLVIIVKALIVAVSVATLKYPKKTILISALTLFQVGEFGFILSKVGLDANVLTKDHYQLFLSVAILAMGITPIVINKSEKWVTFFLKKKILPNNRLDKNLEISTQQDTEELKDHVIIIGFGVNGKNVARALKFAGIPYVIIELNADTVKQEAALGEPIYYGDATNVYLLEHLKVNNARTSVIAISDYQGTKSVISNLRSISKSIYIIVRTRFVKEVDSFINYGADEVVPEEFETSIEIFSRVLNRYLIPSEEIKDVVEEIRTDTYEMMRPFDTFKRDAIPIPDININTIKVENLGNSVVYKTIQDSQIRQKYKVSIVAILRQNNLISEIKADTLILPDDVLYLMGKNTDINNFINLVK